MTRARFASHVDSGLSPILSAYMRYVMYDFALTKIEKRMRLRLARELSRFVYEGKFDPESN